MKVGVQTMVTEGGVVVPVVRNQRTGRGNEGLDGLPNLTVN